MTRREEGEVIFLTLLEEEINYIERFFPIIRENNQSCKVQIPQVWVTHGKQWFNGYAAEYLAHSLIDADNGIFVKLCEIDKRLGLFNEDHILLMALSLFAFDVIQNNEHIQVW